MADDGSVDLMGSIKGAFCCGGRSALHKDRELDVLGIFEERNAMILGMNPKELRKLRIWYVHLWQRKRHWALVLWPGGEPFQARIVDDFVHNATHCYSAEVSSARLFLVYELLVEQGEPYLMLSVKPDFDPRCDQVRPLGLVGPASFEDIGARALSIVRGYRRYSFIGCNCQHFAIEFVVSLGAPEATNCLPDDEAFVHTASDGIPAIGAASAVVAVTASAGVAGVAMLSATQPSIVVPMGSLMLKSVAAGATGVGLVGSLSLLGVVAGYRLLHSVLREEPEGHDFESCSFRPLPLFAGDARPANATPHGYALQSPHSLLTPRGRGGTIGGASRWTRPLQDEPESEAMASCDEPEPEHQRHCTTDEPESESWPQERAAAMAAGGSRVAPWFSAPSWEQPPWAQGTAEKEYQDQI